MDMLGPAILSFIERLYFLRRLKCTSRIEKGLQSVSFIKGLQMSSLRRLKCGGTSKCVLYREVVLFLCP